MSSLLENSLTATVLGYFRDAVESYPDHVLFNSVIGDPVTYRGACRSAATTAAALGELGVRRGDFVVSYMDDTVPTALLDLGCAIAGVIPVPLSPSFSNSYLRQLCRRLDTRWVVTTSKAADRVAETGLTALCPSRAIVTGARWLSLEPTEAFADAVERVAAASGRVRPESLFMVQPTSGSTGTPKLVRRPHCAFARYAQFVGRELADLDGRPRMLAVNALTHAFGLHMFTTALALGAQIDVPSALDTAASLDEVRRLDPTILPMTPRVTRSLHRQARPEGDTEPRLFGPSARVLLTAGGMSEPSLLRAVAATGMDVIEWYGSSEASIVALTRRGDWREGYAGRVVDDSAVRVAADGELQVRSPGLMSGYHGDEVLTGAAFTEGGFYRTGDLGQVTGGGYLRISGRKRDVFNTPEGSNIYPERIETMIEALPLVEEVMLVGDQRPYLVALIVVPGVLGRTGAQGSTDPDGGLDPASAPLLYARFAGDLARLNQRLEPIERIRRFLLLTAPFPVDVYRRVGSAKVRRIRSALLTFYGARIESLYRDGVVNSPVPAGRAPAIVGAAASWRGHHNPDRPNDGSTHEKDQPMTRYTFCDVANIQQTQDYPTADNPTADSVAAAFRESSLLAHNAFVVGDSAARAQAERVLYALHAYHGFGQPMNGVLSTVWGNLIRAKLRPVMTDCVGRQAVTFAEMCSIMGAAVAEADRRDHPLLETLDDTGLRLYARNWYTSTHGFEEQLISILKRSSHRVRQLVFANLADELDTNGIAHVELRAATLRNFGVNHDPDRGGVLDHGTAFADPDVVTAAFALSNVRTAFSLLPDPAFALGCFYSIEACFPAVCRRILTLLRRRGGTERDLFYWSLHGEVDESHSAEWLDGIQRAALPDDVHARIANGAISHLLARSELFAAIADRLSRPAARQALAG